MALTKGLEPQILEVERGGDRPPVPTALCDLHTERDAVMRVLSKLLFLVSEVPLYSLRSSAVLPPIQNIRLCEIALSYPLPSAICAERESSV